MKTFLFDIGNVLVDFDFRVLSDSIAAAAGSPAAALGPKDFEMHDAVERGEITDDQFVAYLNESKGLSWSVDDLIGLWQRMFSLNPVGYELYRDSLGKGRRVYTLSNIAAHHIEAIDRNWPGFFAGATGLFFSWRLGVRKPDAAIYRKVVAALECDPGDCFFIDDRLENVEAARAEGLCAHHFVPADYQRVLQAAGLFFNEA